MNLSTTIGIVLMVIGTNCNILSYGSGSDKSLGTLGLILVLIGAFFFSSGFISFLAVSGI